MCPLPEYKDVKSIEHMETIDFMGIEPLELPPINFDGFYEDDSFDWAEEMEELFFQSQTIDNLEKNINFWFDLCADEDSFNRFFENDYCIRFNAWEISSSLMIELGQMKRDFWYFACDDCATNMCPSMLIEEPNYVPYYKTILDSDENDYSGFCIFKHYAMCNKVEFENFMLKNNKNCVYCMTNLYTIVPSNNCSLC